jgi:hypothetical protein
MTLQDFEKLLKARPFQPFRVHLSSGDVYEIRHPEMAFLMRTKIMLGLDPDKSGYADDWTMISLLHVTSIDPVPAHQKGRKSA